MKNEHLIQIDPEKCVGCGLCVRDCPAANIMMENKKAKVLTQSCLMCGHCVAICPKAAVSMTGFDEPPEEIEKPTTLDPQTLLTAIKTRRSIRQFDGRQAPPEILARIIEAGRFTPTGKNAQDVSFIVLKESITNAEAMAVQLFRRLLPLMKLINPVAKRTVIDEHFFFKKAPVAIALVSRDKVNGALAAANMALMAEACGLGVLYSGFFAMAANRFRPLRRLLGLKGRERVVAVLVLGYSSVHYHRTAQKEAAIIRSA